MNQKYASVTGSMVSDMYEYVEASFVVMKFQQKPEPEQVDLFIEMAEQGIKRGALGFAIPVGYAVEGITSKEIHGLQKLAGEYGVATFVHGRFSSQSDPLSGWLGTAEFLSNLGVYGGGLMFHHIHQQTLSMTGTVLDLIDDARSRGLNVVAEIYPYNFGATIVGADYLVPSNYGPNMGRDYGDITESATGQPLTKARYDELMQTNPGAAVTFFGSTQETMLSALARPDTTVIGSDAFPLNVLATGENAWDWETPYEGLGGHPRGAGTYGLVLRLVREDNLMPLMRAISKMSYEVAHFLEESGVSSMAFKGRMQVGADADIVVFDPETVTDNSTMEDPGAPTTGIPYVLVNGSVVVEDSTVLQGVFPGEPVRMPILE
ncbi:MAG: amidohydrolase family protein [Roseibium sp.]|nr:amidohydrolase family protein [Roseibium sp.]